MLLDSDGRIISTQKEIIGFKDLDLLSIAQQVEQEDLPYGRRSSRIVRWRWWRRKFPIGVPSRRFDRSGESILRAVDRHKSIEIMTFSRVVRICHHVFVVRKTTRPINSLVNEMKKVTQGDFSRHIPVKGNYEVRELATAFNYMLDGLDSYMEQIMTMEDEKREAEIRALQMQINPHFIYNTLASLVDDLAGEFRERCAGDRFV